jgi:transcriptional regulator with XRE-family HTH domain
VYDSDVSDFSKLIRRRRQEAHLTQAELAQRVGVKQQTVARWEQGASTPTSDTLTSIARTFGEPDDEWLLIAGRSTASDRRRFLPPVRSRIDRLPLAQV